MDTPAPATPPPRGGLTAEEFAALDHDDAGLRTNAVIWSLCAMSGVFLAMRVYCKFLRHRGLWWDDWVLVASWLCLVTEACLVSIAVSMGYGKHIWDFPMKNFLKLVPIANVAGTFSIVAAIWSKTSFAITLLRITKGYTKMFVWYIIISMNIAMGLSALFMWISCDPVQKTWNPFVRGTCWDSHAVNDYDIFSASYSGAMDLTLAFLPWPLIWKLQMKPKEKFGVAFAMSMGVFAAITAFVKTSKIPTLLSGDLYDGIVLVLWGNAESAVTIIAASVPVLRVLIRDVRTTVAGRRAGRNGGAGGNGGDESRYFDWTEGVNGGGGDGSGGSKERRLGMGMGRGNGGGGHRVKSKRVRMRSHSHNNTVEIVTRVGPKSGGGNLIGGLAGLSSSSSRGEKGGVGGGSSGADDDRSDRSILVEEEHLHPVHVMPSSKTIPGSPGSPGSMSDGDGGFAFGRHGTGGISAPGTAITRSSGQSSPREGVRIVRVASGHPEGGIIQTRDVTIEYHERREGDAYDLARLPV